MKTALSVTLIISVAIALFTCGGGEDLLQNPPGNIPLPGDVLTDEQRMAVFDDCREFVNALGDITSDEAQQAIVKWLQSRPEFEDAGMESGNVWAYFYDGRVVTILPSWLNTVDPGGRLANAIDANGKIAGGSTSGETTSIGVNAGGTTSGRTSEGVSIGAESSGRKSSGEKSINEISGGNTKVPTTDRSSGTGNRTTGIPLVKNGILLNGVGTGFEDGRQHLWIMFRNSLTEYELTMMPASIDNLKAVKDQAIFYILTHGGIGFKKVPLLSRVYGLWTTDQVTTDNSEKYKDDLNNGALSYSLATQNVDEGYEWHYSITEEFVKKYMTFAENAIVYIDACNSMNEDSKAFGEQMLEKCLNKKGTYVGWTKTTNSTTYIPTQRYIFDRMIGSNDVSGTEQKPDQRPFDFVSVYNDMLTYPEVFHLGISKSGGRLAYNSRSLSEVLLTPSISYITMYDWESIMIIHGMFSDGLEENGHVWINGREAAVTQWSKNFIICKIQDEGADSFGKVWVTYKDQSSNEVPLTSWTIPVTVIRDEAGIKTEATLTLRLRGDVHPFRTEPNGTPVIERWDSLGLENIPGEVGWQFSKASTGQYSVGGSRQTECVRNECQMKDTYSWKADAGDLPYDPFQITTRYGAFYLWSRDLKKITVRLGILIPDIDMTETFYMKCPKSAAVNNSSTETNNVNVNIPSDDFEVIEFELDENYNIIAGDKPKHRSFEWSHCNESVTLSTRVKWPSVNAQNPPTAETAARVGL